MPPPVELIIVAVASVAVATTARPAAKYSIIFIGLPRRCALQHRTMVCDHTNGRGPEVGADPVPVSDRSSPDDAIVEVELLNEAIDQGHFRTVTNQDRSDVGTRPCRLAEAMKHRAEIVPRREEPNEHDVTMGWVNRTRVAATLLSIGWKRSVSTPFGRTWMRSAATP